MNSHKQGKLVLQRGRRRLVQIKQKDLLSRYRPKIQRTSIQLASSIYSKSANRSKDKSSRKHNMSSQINNSFNNIIINYTGHHERDRSQIPSRSSSTLELQDQRLRFRRKVQSSDQNHRIQNRSRKGFVKQKTLFNKIKNAITKFQQRIINIIGQPFNCAGQKAACGILKRFYIRKIKTYWQILLKNKTTIL